MNVPVTVKLPPALWRRVRSVARRDGIKIYQLVRVALERELLRRRPELRKAKEV